MYCYILEKEESAVATIVIRGSTDNIIDDIERAIDDGINVFKALTKVGKSRFYRQYHKQYRKVCQCWSSHHVTFIIKC